MSEKIDVVYDRESHMQKIAEIKEKLKDFKYNIKEHTVKYIQTWINNHISGDIKFENYKNGKIFEVLGKKIILEFIVINDEVPKLKIKFSLLETDSKQEDKVIYNIFFEDEMLLKDAINSTYIIKIMDCFFDTLISKIKKIPLNINN